MLNVIKSKYSYLILFCTIFSAKTFADTLRVGDLFNNLSTAFDPFIVLLFSLATIAGLIFTIVGIFKFKQFKDNPQQISIGQPIGLFLLGAVMLWLPFIIKTIGFTFTGAKSEGELRSEQSHTHPAPSSGFGGDLEQIR